MKLVGHKTESIYRRYAITDEAMLQEAGAKLSAFHRSLVKVASKSGGAEAPEQFLEASADEEVELEAASGLEPENRGFADLRLNHLATPPRTVHYRRTPEVDQDLARRSNSFWNELSRGCSTDGQNGAKAELGAAGLTRPASPP
jgi:hypothetical protein